MKAILGKTPQGKEIPIDVTRLLETRMLVTAASGNGKSRTLRRIAEQTAPLVQQFIFDPEGEFASLRERFDYVICAPSGADAVATPRTAALLARRLLESGVSAILDIYDLKPMERHAFVKNFLEAMINAPKDLWKPVLIILDEAHMFAPQNADCQSTAAVIDMATRGRKRGFCLMPATQRLSKLHKDVAAEMLNKMIGGIELDVDVKRASDDLGKTFKEGRAMLRNLDPGQFYIYGPALIRDITLVKVGDVATTHPGPGQRIMKAPPAPSARVMKLLGELADLPQQAVEEAKTMQDAQVQIRDLNRKLVDAERRAAASGTPAGELKQQLAAAKAEGYQEGLAAAPVAPQFLEDLGISLSQLKNELDDSEASHIKHRQNLQGQIQGIAKMVTGARSRKAPAMPRPVQSVPSSSSRHPVMPIKTVVVRQAGAAPVDGALSSARQKILDVLLEMEQLGKSPLEKPSVAALCQVSPTSSGYQNNLGALRSAGYIVYVAGGVQLTDAGRDLAAMPTTRLTLAEVHDHWCGIVNGPRAEILRKLIEAHPKSIDKTELAAAVGASPTSSGYQNNLGALRSLGAITYPLAGYVAASDLLFPEGVH